MSKIQISERLTTPSTGFIRAATLEELKAAGMIVVRGARCPLLVVYDKGKVFALDNRCPHLGFPLHRGTVEDGLLTCHWHHARFDLASGCTFDLWADDVRHFDVTFEGDDVLVAHAPPGPPVEQRLRRLRDGLESGLSLVIAKSTAALVADGVAPREIVRVGLEFGTVNRAAGWGSGLTVLVAMANVLPDLDAEDRGAALVHALVAVARDTIGRPP